MVQSSLLVLVQYPKRNGYISSIEKFARKHYYSFYLVFLNQFLPYF